ncbi:phosphoglucosamine mutase [Granulicella aggregans]|uniref:Phosphoglucosamine mutase n=1 Tax=Granulicella aggregans TaxID=474949 RepID=A0A7W7ZBB7_9BACT|nr:phosphoglucosamine mutase [Granulicella aggregans]
MKKLFGTDGIRAVAGQAPLDPPTIYAVGLALAHHLGNSPKVLIGMDTRESGPSIAATLTSGLIAGGATVESAGIITTPGVAYLAATHNFAAGIVISASHNPWEDNGIKLFGPDGFKLPDATELAIEAEIFKQLDAATANPETAHGNVTLSEAQSEESKDLQLSGTATTPTVNESDRLTYINFLLNSVPDLTLANQKIVIDCANGAASSIAPQLFASLIERAGGEAIITHASPDGRNINEHCGALHPIVVAQEVVAQKASLGITFDGDADRALFADHHGNVINGDAVLLLAARDLAARNALANQTVVATTMSNMGLEAALKRTNIKMLRANVGDKYVLEQMLATGASLGGEQSGHIIFSGRSTTGDGLLTALLLLDIVQRAGKSLADLTSDLKTFPQVIVNVKVREKRPLETIPTVAAAIAAAEHDLEDSGRVVIRYSGTEALARVMIEAESEPLMRHHSEAIAAAIRTELGI